LIIDQNLDYGPKFPLHNLNIFVVSGQIVKFLKGKMRGDINKPNNFNN